MGMEQYGKAAFEAYKKKVGGKTYDNKDIPDWDNLGKTIQDAWMIAAHDAIELWLRTNSNKTSTDEEGLDGRP